MEELIRSSKNPTALSHLLFRYSIEQVELKKNSTYEVVFPDSSVRFIKLGESGEFDDLIDLYSNYESFNDKGSVVLPDFFEEPKIGDSYLFFNSAVNNNTTKNLVFGEVCV